jgi:hypothetical protein
MGLLDHRSTWRYRVSAPPQACLDAFAAAFRDGGGVLAKAKWEIDRSGASVVATYMGRKGIGIAGSALSKRTRSEEQGAVGSQVTFEVERQDGDRTVCAMWMSQRSSWFGLTLDARFIRPYFRSMRTRLQAIDPSVEIARG